MTNQTETPIQEFARINLMIQRYRASGTAIPFELQQRAQQLETYAHTRLTPEQAQVAMQYVAAEQERLLAEESGMLGQLQETYGNAQQRLADALRNAGARRVSEVANIGRDGKQLGEAELSDAVLKGRYTVPGKQRAVDAAIAKMSGKLGRDVSNDEYKATLARLDSLHDNPNAMSKYLDEQVGDDGVQRAALERRIRATVVAAAIAERRDRSTPEADYKPVTVELNESERLRLDISDRVMAEAGPSFFVETINDRGSEGSIREALVDAVEAATPIDADVSAAQADVSEIERIAAEY